MTIKEAKAELAAYIQKSKADNDSYLIVHFSKSDDYYSAVQKMDIGDALIVIKELVKYFKIDSEVLVKSIPHTV